MTPKLKARELVLTVLNIENSQGWNIRAFETHQLKELYEAIELADFGRASNDLNKIRIRAMGELLIRGELKRI
jgi:hypothetical protein